MKSLFLLSLFCLVLSSCNEDKTKAQDNTVQQEAEKKAFTTHQVKSPPYNITDYTKNPPPTNPSKQ